MKKGEMLQLLKKRLSKKDYECVNEIEEESLEVTLKKAIQEWKDQDVDWYKQLTDMALYYQSVGLHKTVNLLITERNKIAERLRNEK